MKKIVKLLIILIPILILLYCKFSENIKIGFRYVLRRAGIKRSLKSVMFSLKKQHHYKEFKHIQGMEFSKSDKLSILSFKKEKKMEIWLKRKNQNWMFLYDLDIKGLSGKLGPKYQEGDKQVPEGIYPITFLHPNSLFGVSIKVGYPNNIDKSRSSKKGIKDFGGDIFIHNTDYSIGCLAIGDMINIEELFYICGKIGMNNCKAIISPIDFRNSNFNSKSEFELNNKYKTLYNTIKNELEKYKK